MALGVEKQRREAVLGDDIEVALAEIERARIETHVLVRLAQVTSGSEKPEEIYEPAFNAARELFKAERSAILLFDDADRTRFHAFRGLSAAYRAAVEGHSPWTRAQSDARPILIYDVTVDETLAEYRPAFAAERIRAVGMLPLIARRQLLGKLMLYWDHPRAFSTHDEALAMAIALQVAEALERSRLHQMERRSFEAERVARARAEAAEERMAFLAEASVQLSNSLDYQVTLDKVAELVVPRLADWCMVDVAAGPDQALNRFAVVQTDPTKRTSLLEMRQRYALKTGARGGVTQVMSSGRVAVYNDSVDALLIEVAHDPEHLRLLRELEIGSIMLAPITIGTRASGVISFINARSGRKYTEADMQTAEELGRRAGVAIENARLYEEEKRLRLEAQAVAKRRAAIQLISDVGLTHVELDPLLRELLGRVRRIFLCDTATLFVLDEARGLMVVRASDGLEPAAWESAAMPIGSGVVGSIAAQGKPIVAEDLAAGDVECTAFGSRLRSVAGVPLVLGDKTLGVLHVGSIARRAFDSTDLDLLQLVAARAVLALDRANTYDALRAAEQRLRTALSAGRMGVWEWSIRTGRVSWSSTLETIHGILPGSFPGTFQAYQSDIHADDKAEVLQCIRQTLATSREHRVEYRIVRPDGEERWVASHGGIVATLDGQPSAMMGVCMDITERKQTERARAAATAELEQTLRDNELFAGILAHDLRSPLTAILAAVQILAGQRENADDRTQRPLQHVLASGERMTRLIDQLLDFTRARVGGGLELVPRPVDLHALCAQVAIEFETAHPRWNLVVQARGDCDGVWDPDRLLQVISNLIANAFQHGAFGTDISVTLDGTGRDGVSMAIHNDGIISEALVPKLFVAFGNVREGRSGGLGLGLFISKQIIAAHAGRIDVVSSDANGTTFRVWLPRSS